MLETGDITAALEYASRQSDHPVLRVQHDRDPDQGWREHDPYWEHK